MGKKGQLTPDKFGSSMPVTAPAVQSPPFWYRDMEMIIMSYETNEDAAAEILPEGLELTDDASASIVISNYHFSTFGPYCEAILGISCTWEGKPMTYLPNLFVTQEAPLIAGREIWGYGKKLVHIDLYCEHEQYMGIIERPKGNRLATTVMRTVDNVRAEAFDFPTIVSLKVIPNAEEGAPSVAQLVSCEFDVQPKVSADEWTEVWRGPGSLVYNNPTASDPWHVLEVKEVTNCYYGYFNAYLPYGKVLKEYL